MGESIVPSLVCEFVGTYMLVFAVGCNVITGQAVWGVTSIACCLMVCIYAMGGISGGHFNPAVTFAFWMLGTKGMGGGKACAYMAAQFVGGLCGGFSYGMLFWEVFNLQPSPGYGFFQTLCAELLYTFMLVFTVLNVAGSRYKEMKDNQYYGLAIGFCVVAGGYGAGHISGGCFNPAVALAIDISSVMEGLGWFVFYMLFEFAGAGLAVFVFKACRPEEKDTTELFDPTKEGFKYAFAPRLVSEFVGTYFLVLTVGLNVIGGSKAPVWSIGSSLMCMIYALGNVSGAHFNPAVTISILLAGRKKIEQGDAFAYIAVQLIAGVCGGLTYGKMTAHFGEWFKSFPLDPGAGHGWLEAAFAEIAFTFLLAYVVLSVATVEKGLSEYFGLAIGACVIAGGYAIGAVSGGSLNPAVSVGISSSHILGGGHFWHCLVYSLFEIIGGCLAAAVFGITHASEYQEQKDHE